jgi:hypothetical protein
MHNVLASVCDLCHFGLFSGSAERVHVLVECVVAAGAVCMLSVCCLLPDEHNAQVCACCVLIGCKELLNSPSWQLREVNLTTAAWW